MKRKERREIKAIIIFLILSVILYSYNEYKLLKPSTEKVKVETVQEEQFSSNHQKIFMEESSSELVKSKI